MQCPKPSATITDMKTNLRTLHVQATDAFPLGRLDDDPEYQAQAETVARLQIVLRRLQLQTRQIEYRRYVLSGDIDGARGDRAQTTARNLAAIDAELAQEIGQTETTLERALRVGAGGELPEEITDERRLERLWLHERAVNAALAEQLEIQAAIASRLSRQYAENTAAAHAERIRRVYEAACEFARAVDDERAFRVDGLNRGYAWVPDLHPAPDLRAAILLGSESDGELARWRRFLEDRGTI